MRLYLSLSALLLCAAAYAQTDQKAKEDLISQEDAKKAIIAHVMQGNMRATDEEIFIGACPIVKLVDRLYTVKKAKLLPMREVARLVKNPSAHPDFERALYNCALVTLKSVKLPELKANVSTYDGVEIVVHGTGLFVAGKYLLKNSAGDVSPVNLDATNVPPHQRTRFVSRCGDLMSECTVVVLGVVREQHGMPTITASNFLMED